MDYKSAGVNIEAGSELVERIKPIAQKTHRLGVLGGLGGFGSLFELPLDRFRQPVLVSGTDGVGTKLKLAQALNFHHTIGIDLVAMCVNDIVVQGAEPLFFLDYFATGELNVEKAAAIVEGIGRGCELAGAALVGGETAEMPGMYHGDDYDLAGFCVGIVEKSEIIDGSKVTAGDKLIGVTSSGPHSNGFSLIRKIIETQQISLQHATLADKPLWTHLLEPTRIYVKSMLELSKQIPLHALAHITGGGITENLPRVLPTSLTAEIKLNSWEMPEIFQWLQRQGNITLENMLTTFNCGVGMIVCVAAEDEATAKTILTQQQETVFTLGEIVTREQSDQPLRYL